MADDYLVPRKEHVIPHSEHPEAYRPCTNLKIKFIEPIPLYSQYLSPSRKLSDASVSTEADSTIESSASSIRTSANISSPVPMINDSNLHEEARRHEFDFEKEEGQPN